MTMTKVTPKGGGSACSSEVACNLCAVNLKPDVLIIGMCIVAKYTAECVAERIYCLCECANCRKQTPAIGHLGGACQALTQHNGSGLVQYGCGTYKQSGQPGNLMHIPVVEAVAWGVPEALQQLLCLCHQPGSRTALGVCWPDELAELAVACRGLRCCYNLARCC